MKRKDHPKNTNKTNSKHKKMNEKSPEFPPGEGRDEGGHLWGWKLHVPRNPTVGGYGR